jgi:co-chaperonin GroES (HSP10)
VAVGLGDKWIEHLQKIGPPKRTRVTMCAGGHSQETPDQIGECWWLGCDCTKFTPRLKMQCKVGDKVIYDKRRDLELHIGGETYSLVNEEQAILAVIEE